VSGRSIVLFLLVASCCNCCAMNWFSRDREEPEKKEPVTLYQDLTNVPVSDEFKMFLQKGEGSGVGSSLDFVWDTIKQDPEAMKGKISEKISSVGYIGGMLNMISNAFDVPEKMVKGMIQHQPKVKTIFQESAGEKKVKEKEMEFESDSDDSLENCKKKLFLSVVTLRLLDELKESKQKERVIHCTTQFCAGRVLMCVANHQDVIARRVTKNAKAPIVAAVKTVLGCGAKNPDEWIDFLSKTNQKIYSQSEN